jgi:hypothetical protein
MDLNAFEQKFFANSFQLAVLSQNSINRTFRKLISVHKYRQIRIRKIAVRRLRLFVPAILGKGFLPFCGAG